MMDSRRCEKYNGCKLCGDTERFLIIVSIIADTRLLTEATLKQSFSDRAGALNCARMRRYMP
jgi:hypothetical protein